MSDIPPLVIGPLSSSGPKLISKDQWISDEFVTSCQLCKTPFTTFFRRHHCRCCGSCLCSRCTSQSITFEDGKKHRICFRCFNNNQSKSIFPASSFSQNNVVPSSSLTNNNTTKENQNDTSIKKLMSDSHSPIKTSSTNNFGPLLKITSLSQSGSLSSSSTNSSLARGLDTSSLDNISYFLLREITETNTISSTKPIFSLYKNGEPYYFDKVYHPENFENIDLLNFDKPQKVSFKEMNKLIDYCCPNINYEKMQVDLIYINHQSNDLLLNFYHQMNCTMLLHPNLLNYIGFIQLRNSHQKFLIIESNFIDIRTLVLKENRLRDWKSQLEIGRQIASAMNYLHSLNPCVIHGDLKSTNVFYNVETMVCKIGGFGLEKASLITKYFTILSPTIPPEFQNDIIAGTFDYSHYTIKGDVYSFIWILLEMALGTSPEEYTVEQVKKAVKFTFKEDKYKHFRHLIFACLESFSECRIGFRTVLLEINLLLDITVDPELIAQNLKTKELVEEFFVLSNDFIISKNSFQRSLIHQCCIFGNLDGLKQLCNILGGEKLDDVDIYNTSCAHLAARSGHLSILEFLRSENCDLNGIESRFQLTPAVIAFTMNHLDCFRYILGQFVSMDQTYISFVSACVQGNCELVKYFLSAKKLKLDHYFTLVEKYQNQKSHSFQLDLNPLHSLVKGGLSHFSILKILCNYDVATFVKLTNEVDSKSANTALTLAVIYENELAVEFLLKQDQVERKIKNKEEKTAFEIAKEKGNPKIVQLFQQFDEVAYFAEKSLN